MYKKYSTVGAQHLLQTPTPLYFQCLGGLLRCVFSPTVHYMIGDYLIEFFLLLQILNHSFYSPLFEPEAFHTENYKKLTSNVASFTDWISQVVEAESPC